ATSPDHTAAVTDAPATSSDPTPAVTDAPATSSDPSSSATGVPPTSASPGNVASSLYKMYNVIYPCLSNPCGVGSTCEARANHTFVCKCLPGDFYNNITLRCENGNYLFPISNHCTLTWCYPEKIKDAIITKCDFCLNRPSASRMLRAPPGIIAVLQIIFKASSEIKEDDVIKELENNTCDNCVLSGATFEPTDLCAENPCDVKTSNCTSQDGAYSCTCLEKHLQTDFSDRMCTACPSGSRFKDNTCVKCSFGYSGLECSENWQLILVIVGSVLGGLLLIALILLPIIPTM
uniref:EGF-like domain-containing protein n=1 Tax=Maylandia zebra TaxID=106582 RepID=A0A3P9B3A5_9CICH